MTALGDLIEIDDRTVLVLGQGLDLGRGQPDVANALVHRAGATLVLVDTGVTEAFRAALREAAARVGPWSRALVLTTHGHLDHVGNNDLADGLGVPAEHWVPAPDLDQMRDPLDRARR
ncbi:MBL fold metallo-hydrolase [Streptomyces sp. NPDC002104]